ncbi:copper resistance protein [Escherichia coli]|nr:copper resistance protein [Escherichia coli]
MSIKNDGHYFCRAGGNRPDGLNEPVTHRAVYPSDAGTSDAAYLAARW